VNFANRKSICESKIDFAKNSWFLRKKMTERSKIFSKKIVELFEKKFRIERKKRKSEKRWLLYAKFDVRVTKWYFCEMIWLTRFYDFYVSYERVFFVRSICHSYFMYFTNAILCSINESFVFYVFYERTSLFNRWVIRILCILRTHFFVWSMSHSYFTNACLCLIDLSFVNLLSHQFVACI
jgi:ribosomal protein S18